MFFRGPLKTAHLCLWPFIIGVLIAQKPELESDNVITERKITEVVMEDQPQIILGELELRRLEPYFAKQAWNWRQLYDVQCTRNPHPGSCSRSLTRWFFYPTFGKCYAFLYGGCGGTANRFPSERECVHRCVPRQRPMRPPPAPDEPTLAPPPETGQLNAMLARHDNDTAAEVQRMAEPVTVPPATRPARPAVLEHSSPPTPSHAAAATDFTGKPKSKREFPSQMEQAEQLRVEQNWLNIDRIILR